MVLPVFGAAIPVTNSLVKVWAEGIIKKISHARFVDFEGTNHYTIMFQPNRERNQIIMDFLDEGEG